MSHRRFFYLFLALCLLVSLPLMTSAAPVPEKEYPPVADCSSLADPEARAKLPAETLASLQATCKAEAEPAAAQGVVEPLRTGGPDAFGYTFADQDSGCTYDFTDISATGTRLFADVDDGGSGSQALAQPFTFYGTAYNALVMSSNGYLSTNASDSGGDLSNNCPLPGAGGARLFPLHDDLVSTGWMQYFATCPRSSGLAGDVSCTIFQWNARHFGGGDNWDMQAILYHGSGTIVYQIGAGNPDHGSGSTTGIQDATATIGLTYACNTANSVPDNTAVCFMPPGISIPPHVTIASDQARTVRVGNSMQYHLTVTNWTSSVDTINLSLGAHTWPTVLSANSLPLGAYASGIVDVTVSAPASATSGSTDAVVVTAAGQGSGLSDTATLTTRALIGNMSGDVAIVDSTSVINGGTFPTTTTGPTGSFTDFNFTTLPVANVDAAHLASYDTVLLNMASPGMNCNAANLTASQKTDLVNWMDAGGKLIIHDSECAAIDYSWLPFPFTTNNPGAMGAHGTANVVENSALISNNPADLSYVDAALMASETDAVGDMNVAVTVDSHLCLSMAGTNANQVQGPALIYARSGDGLLLWNGLDMDDMGAGTSPDAADADGNIAKLWLNELQVPFNPTPFSEMPCGVAVIGIGLAPGEATNPVGSTHTVTATLTDQGGEGRPDIPVTFTVLTGPNAGASGACAVNADCTTDANGQVSFTYTGAGGPGTDEIQACFLSEDDGDGDGQTPVCSQIVTKTWEQVGFRVFGYIFVDANSNGVRDLTEQTGIQVPVTLKQGATTVGSVWSYAPGGWYDFGLYHPGSYCVQAAIPPEYVVTSANPVCFTLDQNRGINIGVRLGKATIGDFVWYDDNANGIQDPGELGIGNVTVALWSGAGGAPGSILQTATTAGDGKYLFDVVPGTYFVQVTDTHGVLTGLTLTVGPQSKPNPAGPISVMDGAAYLDADFGYALVCATGRGGLSGHVWWDANGDGMLGGSEAGIAGVTVCAQPLSYLATRCTVTNGWGVYRMCLPKGTYLVAPDKGSPPLAGLTATTKEFLLPAVIKPGTHVEASFGYK